MAKLLVDEEGKRRVAELSEDSITIGRGAENELVIRDKKSSRNHCRVAPEGDGYVLEDLQSSNGTYLNGKLTNRESLAHGDVINVGQVSITFLGEAGPIPEKPATSAPEAAPEPKPPEPAPSSILEEDSADDPASENGDRPWLQFATGERAGEKVLVETVPFQIGRRDGNHLAIADARVSGLHARILQQDQHWVIEDCDSGNGLYVGGQRLKRHVLRPGDRIGIGATELEVGGISAPVGVEEPTVRRAAPGKPAPSKAAGPPPSMKAIGFGDEEVARIDVQAAIGKGSPYQAIFTVLFVALFLAVLAFGWNVAHRIFTPESELLGSGSLLQKSDNPSFELVDESGAVPGWRLDPRSASVARIESVRKEPRARHGKRALTLATTGAPSGGFVRVESESTFEVGRDSVLRLSGWMRNEGFPLAGLEIIWLARSGDELVEVGSSHAGLLRQSGSSRAINATLQPPPESNAEKARVAIYGRGQGRLEVDAIALTLEDDATLQLEKQTLAAAVGRGSDLEFAFATDGSFSLRRGRSLVAANVRFTAPAAGEVPLGQLLALSVEPPARQENGSVRSSFAFLAEAKREEVVTQLSQGVTDAHRISWSCAGDGGFRPAIAVELEARPRGASMALFRDGSPVASGALADITGQSGDEWVIGKDAEQIIFSFSVPVKVEVLPKEQCRAGRSTMLLRTERELPGGILDLYVSTLSTREQESIAGAFAAAETARLQGRQGEALRLLKQLEETFSHLEDVKDRTAPLRREIEREATERLAELNAIRDDLKQFGTAPVADLLRREIDAYAGAFDGLPEVAQARQLETDLAASAAGQRATRSARAASEILEAGKTHFTMERDETARFYLRWLREAHPDSDEAQQAETLLRRIDARNQ